MGWGVSLISEGKKKKRVAGADCSQEGKEQKKTQ